MYGLLQRRRCENLKGRYQQIFYLPMIVIVYVTDLNEKTGNFWQYF
jgi:hypothetical protein